MQVTPARVAKLAMAIAIVAHAPAGRSAIVECTDARGVSILTSDADGSGCAGTTRPAATRTARASTASASPASFPRVDAATQRARDSDRASILKDELDREQRQLVATESRLRTRPQGPVEGIDTSDLVALLARTRENIRAIQAELAGVR